MPHIRNPKDKLGEYSAKCCVNSLARKSGKFAPSKNVKIGSETAVMKWYVHQQSMGVNIRDTKILQQQLGT